MITVYTMCAINFLYQAGSAAIQLGYIGIKKFLYKPGPPKITVVI